MNTRNHRTLIELEPEASLRAANLERGFHNIINGERVSSGRTIAVVNPANGERLALVPDIDRSGLDQAVAAARKAFPRLERNARC